MVKKKCFADRESYSLEGIKELFTVDDLEEDKINLVVSLAISKGVPYTGDALDEIEVTECMIALYLFTFFATVGEKPCLRELKSFLKMLRCDGIIDVHRT